MYDYHSRSHSPRSPILARAVGRSSAVSPLPPSWMPPASLPRTGLNACETLRPLAAFFKGVAPLFVEHPGSYGLLGTSPRASRHAASGAGGVALAPDVMNQVLRRAIERAP